MGSAPPVEPLENLTNALLEQVQEGQYFRLQAQGAKDGDSQVLQINFVQREMESEEEEEIELEEPY
jgi:hypothetical protein